MPPRATIPLSLLLASLLSACTLTQAPAPASPPLQPEAASGFDSGKRGWSFSHQAVAAANPLATEAGARILADGGTAVDAAVAVQMVLTLVEPQSSGIGGGAFLLHHDGRAMVAYDGRETAPAAADERLFLAADGKPLPFHEAIVGGRAVGVPGAVRMLELAHREHGRLPWARLFESAIDLAERGFPVSPRLHTLLAAEPHLKRDPAAAALYYRADGTPLPVGHLLKNPALAQSLRAIAAQGSRALHEGPLAQAIVDKVRQHPSNPGRLSLQDMAAYQPRKREALCHAQRAQGRDWRICGFPPPSSGGIAVAQILGTLAHTGAERLPLADGLPSAEWLHRYTEASRLAFADRAQYLADPDFVPAPGGRWDSLVAPDYLAARARLIGPQRMKDAPAGAPAGARLSFAPMPAQPEYGTSHVSIVDRHGHALAMTTTIEDAFGARQLVGGFLLNNELSDFSFQPNGADGRPVANRVQPGKRPRSSMAPTLVLDDQGQVALSLGSPGGALIIHYTAKTLYALLHWGLVPQQAVALPHFGTLGGPLLLEPQWLSAGARQALADKGHELRETPMTSGLQALQRSRERGMVVWRGGADPRREGTVAGQ